MHAKKGFTELVAIGVIAVIGIAGIWGINRYITDQQPTSSPSESAFVSPVTTRTLEGEVYEKFEEFPFMELTIPYLRSRIYESSFGDLKEVSKKNNYTAYTTSYDSDGLRINGYLTIPDGPGPFPAIVFIHGYIPPTIYRTTENYVSYVDYFARNGFVVFKPDLRGHDASEGEAFGAYYSGGYVIDTLNAYTAVSDATYVDSSKVGLWGHSMGGNIVFRSLVAQQNIPTAVIWAGAVYTYEDMREYSIQDNSYRPPTDDSARQQYRQELNDTYGSFDSDSDFWQKVVPTNYLEGVTSKLQIHHAVNDSVVDIGYSKGLIELLEDTSISASLREYPTGGHNIISPSFESAMSSSVDFYNTSFQ